MPDELDDAQIRRELGEILDFELVRRLDAEKRERSGVDEPWIVDRLVRIVGSALEDTPRLNALGEPVRDPETGEPMTDPRDLTNANRALAQLSKITGLHVARTEVEVAGEVVYTLTLDRDLSTEADE